MRGYDASQDQDTDQSKMGATQTKGILTVRQLNLDPPGKEEKSTGQISPKSDDASALKMYLCNMIDEKPHLAVGFKRKFDRLIRARKEYTLAWCDFSKYHEDFFDQQGADYSDDPVYYQKMQSSNKMQKK